MNKFLFIPFAIFFLIFGCKPSQKTRKELIQENTLLKNQIAQINQNRLTQNDVALELTNMNVVYRGVANPIRATINNAEKIEISGIGVSKDKDGNYNLRPGSGLKVKVFIKGFFKSGDSISFEKELRIKNLPAPKGTLNGIGCGSKCIIELTKTELKTAKIGVKLEDFVFDMSLNPDSYKIKFPTKEPIKVNGKEIDDSLHALIDKLETDDEVIIYDIHIHVKGEQNYKLKSPTPIRIKIIEEI